MGSGHLYGDSSPGREKRAKAQRPARNSKETGGGGGLAVSVPFWRMTQGTRARSQLRDAARDLNFILKKSGMSLKLVGGGRTAFGTKRF